MFTSTLLLRGELIIEGVKFIWWVIDATPRLVTVSHPLHGTRTAPVDGDPTDVARRIGRSLLPKRRNRLAAGQFSIDEV
jgi:hypothetical protein